jgi:hypothetical protein
VTANRCAVVRRAEACQSPAGPVKRSGTVTGPWTGCDSREMARRIGVSRRTVMSTDVPAAPATATHSSSLERNVHVIWICGLGRCRTSGGTAGTEASRRPSSPGGRGAQLTGSSVRTARVVIQTRETRSAKGGAPSADDDLDPTVLRFANARAGLHQQMRVSEALNGDGILRHTVLDQLDLHRARTTERKTLVVFGRA